MGALSERQQRPGGLSWRSPMQDELYKEPFYDLGAFTAEEEGRETPEHALPSPKKLRRIESDAPNQGKPASLMHH